MAFGSTEILHPAERNRKSWLDYLRSEDLVSYAEFSESTDNLERITNTLEGIFVCNDLAFSKKLDPNDFFVVKESEHSRDLMEGKIAFFDPISRKVFISEKFFNDHEQDGGISPEHRFHVNTHESIHLLSFLLSKNQGDMHVGVEVSNYGGISINTNLNEAITEWLARSVTEQLDEKILPGYQDQVTALQAIARKFGFDKDFFDSAHSHPFVKSLLMAVKEGSSDLLVAIVDEYGNDAIMIFESFKKVSRDSSYQEIEHNKRIINFFESEKGEERERLRNEIIQNY